MGERKLNEEEERISPISRVIFQKEDGTVEFLDGVDASLWVKTITDFVLLGYSHGDQRQRELNSLNWKKAERLGDIVNDTESSK